MNLVYRPGSAGAATPLFKVGDASKCPTSGDQNAWYYDNDAAPTQILLCKSVCEAVSADRSGGVDVELGCATITSAPK